jgi:hypothetical protein
LLLLLHLCEEHINYQHWCWKHKINQFMHSNFSILTMRLIPAL